MSIALVRASSGAGELTEVLLRMVMVILVMVAMMILVMINDNDRKIKRYFPFPKIQSNVLIFQVRRIAQFFRIMRIVRIFKVTKISENICH